MDRRAASQHGRTQWNSARFVIVHVRLLLNGRLLVFRRASGCGYRFAFVRGSGRGGWGSGSAALLGLGRALDRLVFRRRFRLADRRRLLRLWLLFLARLPGFFPALVLVGGDHGGVATEIAPQLFGVVVVDWAGMGQGFGDAELVQFIDDLTRLDFELPRQLIDSDLTHV
jgi:hypothetical protein